MQITIFGGGGRVGSLVVAAALQQGHEVVAFVHSEPRFAKSPHLKVVKGDIHDEAAVASALTGSQAVISTLGSWGTPTKDILTIAMQHIIPAMQAGGVQRIVSLTGSDARAVGDSLSLMHRLSHASIKLAPGLRKILADGEQHIKLLEASGLDWTVVRSPVMNGRGNPARYELTDKRSLPWATINRESVALSLLQLIGDTKHARQAPYISRR